MVMVSIEEMDRIVKEEFSTEVIREIYKNAEVELDRVVNVLVNVKNAIEICIYFGEDETKAFDGSTCLLFYISCHYHENEVKLNKFYNKNKNTFGRNIGGQLISKLANVLRDIGTEKLTIISRPDFSRDIFDSNRTSLDDFYARSFESYHQDFTIIIDSFEKGIFKIGPE